VIGRAAHAASITALSLVLVGAAVVPPPPSVPLTAAPPVTPSTAAPSSGATTTQSPADAAPPTLADRAAAIERTAGEPDGERVVLGHLSRKLSMSAETLRAQRAQTGLGWGDLLIANRLALETHVSFETLIAEMRGGQDWESVARAHGADLERLQIDTRASEEAVEQRSDDKAPHATTVPGSGKGHGRAGGGGRSKRGS
jgi:hypothetical protein